AASTVGWVAEDDGLLYLRTNLGAPNWRLAVADPTDPIPTRWRDLIPESEHPLTRAFPTRDAVVAMYEVDATNRVTIHDRATGDRRAEVAMPGRGSVMGLSTAAAIESRDEFWFTYTDFVTPPRIYQYNISDAET